MQENKNNNNNFIERRSLLPAQLQPYSYALGRWARGSVLAGPETGWTGQRLSKLTRPQPAQAIVEFLLVSVPLLALIFGILEFGLAHHSARQHAVSTCIQYCHN